MNEQENLDNVLVGTSGWSYDEWVGEFYPRGLEKRDFLPYYSSIFYTNEINTTFYHIPSVYVVRSWADRTPANFLFSAKLPQDITHKAKLDYEESFIILDDYLQAMDPLMKADKLLAFLIQLPPSFKKKEHFGNLKEFIANWPQERKELGYHLVVEFRHKSWMDEKVFSYLKSASLTYCAVIEPLLPPRMDVTNPKFAYIRFHGYGKKIWFDYMFQEEEIRKWASEVNKPIEQAEKVGIYFNNHFSGYAAKNSLMMLKELNLKPRKDPSKVEIAEIKKKAGTLDEAQTSLDKFFK